MRALHLGVDVGTTWCKAAVVDEAGVEHRAGRVVTPWRSVATGHETDPETILAAVHGAINAALTAAPEGRVVAVGVTGMAEAGVLLDGRGRPAAPIISWDDLRGESEAERLAELPAFPAVTGLAPSAKAPIAKLAALGARRGQRWLSLPEWIAHRLGGDAVAEPSLASRTGLLDVHRGRWWDDALAWLGVGPDFLPPLVAAGTLTGRGVAVAGHDHVVAAVGAGATGDGDLLDSCGTAEALVRSVGPLDADETAGAVADGLSAGCHVLGGRVLIGGFPSGRRLAGLDLGSPSGRSEIAAVARRALATRERIEAHAGPTRRLVVTGGWAAHPEVAEAKRAVLGDYELAPVTEAGCVGAARLAGSEKMAAC